MDAIATSIRPDIRAVTAVFTETAKLGLGDETNKTTKRLDVAEQTATIRIVYFLLETSRETSLTAFTWKVCETGYKWLKPDSDARGELILMPVNLWPAREYEPLKTQTGLFREFAGLRGDAEEFRRFADRYGTLCPPPAGSDKQTKASETLAFWKAQNEAISAAAALWDAIQANEADPGDLGHVAEAIDLGRRGRVVFHFSFDRRQRRFEDVPVPADLIGAIWQQFADAVADDRQYRRCPAPGCGRWYELSPTAKGPDKNHCSVACKQRAYRHRKGQALDLLKNRRTVEQIAEELNTPVETVKRWLAGVPQVSGGSTADEVQGNGGGSTADEVQATRPGLQL